MLGLDLGTHANLSLPLRRALERGSYQTSLPFKLVEGYDAYVMFMPVLRPTDENVPTGDTLSHHQPLQIVLIVLLQNQLIGDISQILPDSMGLLIYHSDRKADDPIGWLYNKPATGYRLQKSLVKQYRLEPEREGFLLRLQQNFGLNSISLDVLGCAAAASALIFFFNRYFILLRYQREIDRSKKEARLELLASYDPLTKLPNRNWYQEWIKKFIGEAAEDSSIATVLMDLEGLREINEQYGHPVGDSVLIEVAARIRQTLSDDDLVIRVGGDEFVAVLTHHENDDKVSEVVEKLNQRIQEPIQLNEESISVKVNIGVSFYPEGTNQPEQLMQLADKVMYQSKRTRERRHGTTDFHQG